MSPLFILMETALLACAVCALHGLKPRLGLAPIYVVLGAAEVFLFVAGKTSAPFAEVFLAPPARLGAMLFMPLILSIMVVIYALEGTAEARRLFGALVAVYLFHGAVDMVLAWHGAHPPPGMAVLDQTPMLRYSHIERLASLGSFLVDGAVMIIVYQALINRAPWLPRPLILFLGLFAAMLTDAVAYPTFTGRIFSRPPTFDLLQKAQTGLAAAIPTALYITWHRRRFPGLATSDRGALELIDLRRRLEDFEAALARQQARYQEMRDVFGRYLSPRVVDVIAANPEQIRLGGESREVTILFADIRGYSTLAEIMDPAEIIDMLNRYFGRVGEIILGCEGMINEFEGDAVLAVFGAPLEMEDHAARALRAAAEMLKAVEALNREWADLPLARRWKQAGLDGLAIRVGLHTGAVVVGNVGSAARMKYAVIGDTVNLASRVEGLNKDLGTAVLLTEATRQHIAHRGLALPLTEAGTHKVKGRAEPVTVFTVEPHRLDAALAALPRAPSP